MYENYRFKNSFQIAKYLTDKGCKEASKLFPTIRKSVLQACYCFRFNYYHSIRANTRALYRKDKNFLLFFAFLPETNILVAFLIPTVMCLLFLLATYTIRGKKNK